MRQPNPSTEPAPIAGARMLAWLGGCMIFGLLIQTLLARIDRTGFAKLEAFSENTAVGDHVYYPLPSPPPNPPAAVARVGGQDLVPVSYEKIGCRDIKMEASARDSAAKLTIYELRKPSASEGAEKFYFVKIAANEYLKLRVAKP